MIMLVVLWGNPLGAPTISNPNLAIKSLITRTNSLEASLEVIIKQTNRVIFKRFLIRTRNRLLFRANIEL